MSLTEKRLTPEGQEVVPGALAQGFPVTLPDLRIEAIYETVEPDTFRGRLLAGRIEVATTHVTETEPEAIVAAEQLIVDGLARIFAPPPA